MGLDAVELVMEVEDAFGISLPEQRFPEMKTVGDMRTVVIEEAKRQRGVTLEAEGTFEKLRQIICSVLHVKPSDVRPETEFIRDLKMD